MLKNSNPGSVQTYPAQQALLEGGGGMRLFDIAAQRARRARGARSYHRKFELASHITPLVQATSNKFIP